MSDPPQSDESAFVPWQRALTCSRDSARFGEAEQLLHRALAAASQRQDQSMVAESLMSLGELMYRSGRLEDAITYFNRRLAIKPFGNQDRSQRRTIAAFLRSHKAK